MRGVLRMLKEVAAPGVIALWVVYLGYGAFAGAAGFGVLADLEAERDEKQAALDETRVRREALAHHAKLLNPKSLDPDMIDERIRAVLGYTQTEDIVIPRAELEMLLSEQHAERD